MAEVTKVRDLFDLPEQVQEGDLCQRSFHMIGADSLEEFSGRGPKKDKTAEGAN